MGLPGPPPSPGLNGKVSKCVGGGGVYPTHPLLRIFLLWQEGGAKRGGVRDTPSSPSPLFGEGGPDISPAPLLPIQAPPPSPLPLAWCLKVGPARWRQTVSGAGFFGDHNKEVRGTPTPSHGTLPFPSLRWGSTRYGQPSWKYNNNNNTDSDLNIAKLIST